MYIQKPKCCSTGELVPDVCGCCKICAKGEGEECGGIWNLEGICATGFYCKQIHDDDDRPGRCVAKNEYNFNLTSVGTSVEPKNAVEKCSPGQNNE